MSEYGDDIRNLKKPVVFQKEIYGKGQKVKAEGYTFKILLMGTQTNIKV